MVEVITGKKLFSPDGSDEIYAVKFPSIADKDRARILFQKTFIKLRKEGLPTKDKMREMIKSKGLLPERFYMDIANYNARIKSLQNSLDMTTSKAQVAELNIQIEMLTKIVNRLQRQEDALLENTIEMKAEDVRVNYMLSKCTLCGEELEDLYWESYEHFCNDIDKNFLFQARYNFMKMMVGIPPELIRALARSQEWRHRWKASKQTGASIFQGDSSTWDKNKVSICYWSDFYDSVLGYTTPPPEEIVTDDEALFQWIKDVNRINAHGGEKSAPQNGEVKRVDTPYKVRPKGSFEKL